MKRLLSRLPAMMFFICAVAQSQNEFVLKPWVEVYGTVPGQELGRYVTGIVPTANLPFRAAVSRFGSTGVYRLNSTSDTTAQMAFVGEDLLSGDLNSDGWTDVVISKAPQYDAVYVYWGTPTGLDTLHPLLIAQENRFDRLRPAAIADITNDGRPDLSLAAWDYPGGSNYGKVYIYKNPVSLTSLVDTLVGEAPSFGFGWLCAVGDVNNDGARDLMVRGTYQGQGSPWYNYVDIFWGSPHSFKLSFGVRLHTTAYWGGLACFDVNGDSVDDLLWAACDTPGVIETEKVYVHFGGAAFDTIPSLWLQNPGLADFGWTVVDAGDMNGDGYHDVAVGAPYATTVYGFVWIFAGGPSMDGLFDAAVGKATDSYFGEHIASVGDVTGDGLADIIVGARYWEFLDARGYWGIFMGDRSIAVTVPRQGEEQAKEFVLGQAYPNPFNATTSIDYSLERSAKLRIEVFDLLGRLVSTLVEEEKEAGHYRVRFDAASLTSGAYFYRMQATSGSGTTFTETKTVTLIK